MYDSLITYMKRTESNKTSSHNKPEYAYFDELVLRNCDNSNRLVFFFFGILFLCTYKLKIQFYTYLIV